jgi:hypothetical protein
LLGRELDGGGDGSSLALKGWFRDSISDNHKVTVGGGLFPRSLYSTLLCSWGV